MQSDTLKYKFNLGKEVWVDALDVRSKDEKGFFGIAPGKTVRLRYGPFVEIISVEDNLTAVGKIISLEDIKDYKSV